MRKILIENMEISPRECSYGMPWRHDANCFNFNVPEETVLKKDIEKIEDNTDIDVLVIGCDLEDYDFISEMVNLRQLYIYKGNNLKDISFLKSLINLQQLYISESHIASLDALVKLIKEQKRLFDAETDFGKRLIMGLDAICINSDLNLNGKELMVSGVCASEIIINSKKIHRMYGKPKSSKFLGPDGEE